MILNHQSSKYSSHFHYSVPTGEPYKSYSHAHMAILSMDTNNLSDLRDMNQVILLVHDRFWLTSGFIRAAHAIVLHQKSDHSGQSIHVHNTAGDVPHKAECLYHDAWIALQ
mmetsp:Transcript_22957/g.32957  ORF Transcript_22957/g.32957 Transcript_22957/m.32957 type:complete len:111 (-) Transcript_22957:144-476(-)